MIIKNREEIRNDFLGKLENELSKMEGTYNFDIASTTGITVEELYNFMDYWSKQAFIEDATEDEYVDKHALVFGVERRDAVRAVGEVTINGKANVVIKDGTIVFNKKGTKYETTENLTLNAAGVGKVKIECLEKGTLGNCGIGEIIGFEIVDTNLYTVTNEGVIEGGFDKEDNKSLIERARENVLRKAHSGNVNDYIQWAKSVSGVGKVHVIPLWNGNGTVKVLISDYDNEEANVDLIERVKERIEAPDGRPVGADVTVESFKRKDILVKVKVKKEDGIDIDILKVEIQENIKKAYKLGTVFYEDNSKLVISINRTEKVVLSSEGVKDCLVTLNGGSVNITIEEDYIPHLKDVVVDEE